VNRSRKLIVYQKQNEVTPIDNAQQQKDEENVDGEKEPVV
jgi:hypothetical protein